MIYRWLCGYPCGEKATSDHHSAGGCKVDASLVIVIGNDVQAVWSDHRSNHFLPSNLSVHVSDNDFHTSPRTAVVHLLKLRLECFFLVVESFLVWAMHVDDAVVEETALHPQLTHPSLLVVPPLW